MNSDVVSTLLEMNKTIISLMNNISDSLSKLSQPVINNYYNYYYAEGDVMKIDNYSDTHTYTEMRGHSVIPTDSHDDSHDDSHATRDSHDQNNIDSSFRLKLAKLKEKSRIEPKYDDLSSAIDQLNRDYQKSLNSLMESHARKLPKTVVPSPDDI